jgi:M6 family metalloprotease-like protein
MWGFKPVFLKVCRRAIFTFCLVLSTAGFSPAGERMYRVSPVEVEEGGRDDHSAGPRFRSQVSGRNLLGLQRPGPAGLPVSKFGVPLALSTMIDTLNILALKTEFQRENPDDPNTTGDGTFDMRTYEQFLSDEDHYIDPAPHTTSYFNSHMEALRRYWYFVSDGKLDLIWDVYPREESLTYRLQQPMSYYGQADSFDEVAEKLGYFFIDAVSLADSVSPEIDFSQYDALILFHAGADQQNNIPFINDTPYDLFTGFLILSEPVYVDSGLVAVQEGTIMPEAVSQDNRITALNAVMAHEFGHQLGLIDLYNTATFLTQVGDFALMDNNGMSVGVQFPDIRPTVGGTLPVYASAWSRAFLGFSIPQSVTDGTDVRLTATALPDDSTEIVKVPVTDFEYFLMENRQPDADTLEPGYPFDNVLIGDSLTGVILGPGYAFFEGNDTVLVADAEYDRLLPGDGALIWHVDEFVAYQSSFPGYNNYQTNSLQWDKDRRFLTLVEADGVVDFGGDYYRGFGDQGDFYRLGGNTMLTPFSRPSSESVLGADTHISITDVTLSDTVMTVDVNIDWLLPGWPQMAFPGSASDPVLADLDADGHLDIMVTADTALLIYRYDGERFIDSSDTLHIVGFDGEILSYPWGLAAVCDTTIAAGPVPVDLNGDDTMEVAAATASGRLFAFASRDEDSDGRLDPLPGFPVQLTDSMPASLVATDFDSNPGSELLFAAADGAIRSVNESGSDSLLIALNSSIYSMAAYSVEGYNIIDVATKVVDNIVVFRLISGAGELDFSTAFTTQLGHYDSCMIACGDIDRDGELPELVATCGNRLLVIDSDGSVDSSTSMDETLGPPALGDVNGDGYPEIIVAGGARIYAFHYNGRLMTNFPVNLEFYDLTGAIAAEPVLGDVDGDGLPDVITGLPGGTIHAYNHHADRVAGFPLPSSFAVSKSCALGDLDGDGDLDLVSLENSGLINAWDMSFDYSMIDLPWDMRGGDFSNRHYLSPAFERQIIASDEQLPEGSVYNYPNPASNSTTIRYYLQNESDVTIDIYDFMGENVKSFTTSGQAHADNEFVWDCSPFASGVYFCRVEADDGNNKKWQIIKIALVK